MIKSVICEKPVLVDAEKRAKKDADLHHSLRSDESSLTRSTMKGIYSLYYDKEKSPVQEGYHYSLEEQEQMYPYRSRGGCRGL